MPKLKDQTDLRKREADEIMVDEPNMLADNSQIVEDQTELSPIPDVDKMEQKMNEALTEVG